MANIYLRLPSIVCGFYRGLDEDHTLREDEPFSFSQDRHEYVVLAHNLRLIPEENQSSICFGQRAWNNMLHGRQPRGGRTLLRRESTDWLTAEEICLLCEKDMTQKQLSMDYLCIEMPREAVVNKRICQTNASYTLSYDAAVDLAKMMRTWFKYQFLEWLVQDKQNCDRLGVHRKRLESIERFLAQYDVPVSTDRKERESLRRQANRWIKDAKLRPNDRLDLGTTFITHVSAEELRRKERMEQQGTRKKV